ncbi:MAG: carbohydrate kinase, partial [Bacteroidota bacterium]
MAEITDEDGDPCEDVLLLSQWVVETLTEIIQIREFDIKAVNFSAYGASLVYINERGKVIAPLYSYLKSYPGKLKDEFYKKYGGAEKISCETASPVLGSLNSGMQLYRIMREKPALYHQIKYALHLPQYISYIITQQPYSDITSLGSHTQLWDYQKSSYHLWVTSEGINEKLAPILPSDTTIEIFFADKKIKAGTGLHDSSAALIPYLAVFKEPFVLISTGTWCISLNPFNNSPLTIEELKQDCLCYLEYNGSPVKASRLFAGNEHEQQVKRIARHFNKQDDFYKTIKYNQGIITSLKKTLKFYSNPGVGVNQSNFNHRDLVEFASCEEAYHCLMLDIMQQQMLSAQIVIHHSDVKRIFVDGGFSNNSIYM